MPEDQRHHVFISHVSEADPVVQDLKVLLARNGRDVRNSSIDSLKPNNAQNEQYVKTALLMPRLKWCQVLLVLISKNMRDSDYVRWEIETANKLGKPIIGIWEKGAGDDDVPPALRECAQACVVGWNSGAIFRAIEGNERGWFNGKNILTRDAAMAYYNC